LKLLADPPEIVQKRCLAIGRCDQPRAVGAESQGRLFQGLKRREMGNGTAGRRLDKADLLIRQG
jgi:hypothetical protein